METAKVNIAEKATNVSVPPGTEPSKKCNLSFSFNFDFDDVKSDNSTDSETADLQIDVSEVANYEPSSKHKRETVEEASVLNEMEEEIERQLDAKAAKINLTATNVKNILKHVITNEHVMAMVQKRLHDTEDDVVFEPKLTRAKAKELAAAQVNIPWPITPVKKTSSEVQVLIEEELPEDSSDEEYNPEHDKQSDDDREAENSTSSDVDSQPPTPANSCDVASQGQPKSPDVQYDPEGIFKIPGIPHIPTEEENIGQRTRSKLCLSETPLEQIEQAFVPPDITTDMYDWDCEVDEDWDNFLKEFTQPLKQDPAVEDDPEADPEYNILEDEETDLLDKEELRADKAVKITRKELNNLIAELFEFTDTFSKQEQEVSKKKKSPENTNSTLENNSLNCSMVDLLPVLAEPELPRLVNLEQRHLLATQFRQHIQLMTQHFAMTFMHPVLHSQSKTCKQNLNSISYLSNGPHSAFNAENLPHALKLVADWENKFLDSKFHAEFKKIMADEDAIRKIYIRNKWKYIPKFHPELEKIFVESKALMYPQLLPQIPFRSELNSNLKSPYLKSEESLVALGLEQFLPFVVSRQRKFKGKKVQLVDAAQLIAQYLLPCREPTGVLYHIQKRRCSKEPNPVKHYFEKGSAPRTIHYITLECDLRAPQEQPISLLPVRWQAYLTNTEQKIDSLKRKHILNFYGDLTKKGSHTNEMTRTFDNHPLRNPVVNMLPKILPANSKPSANNNTIKNNSQTHDKTDTSTSSYKACKNNLTYSLINQPKQCPMETDTGTDDIKEPHVDVKDKSKNTISTRNSKVSKKPEVLSELPQLRKTTPRLAKTRSAQNMKLMAQVLGSKGLSNCNVLKSKGKDDSDRNSENDCALSKVDNEDEIAELMLASTTIKKDSVSRKKAKQARELENMKRLLEAENPMNEQTREAKFAASYLQKLHMTLESNNPETFRAVIKLYLEYNEKMDSISQTENDIPFSYDSKSPEKIEDTEKGVVNKDLLAINLYKSVCEKLQDHPELCTDFLLFLKPHQAAMINKSVEYMMLKKMNEFINVAQIYFAKQPSRIAKIMQAITQLSSDPQTTLENVNAAMVPILKSHPLVMDLFLQVLPTAKPPESLFAPHMFENLTCPLGPHDKNKVHAEDAPELYETIELPVLTPQEDPYGGDNCKCNCHNAGDPNFKNSSEHCVSCGTRFLNGRIYLQTSEGLRPAKITFPGAEEEQLENIARVSLKTTDKFIPPPPSRQRRKSAKNETNDELCQKQCSMKNSPSKDNEENEKFMTRSRKGAKSPSKSIEQKRSIKRSASMDVDVHSKKMRTSQGKNKREKKNEKKEVKVDISEKCLSDSTKVNKTVHPNVEGRVGVPHDNVSRVETTSSKSSNINGMELASEMHDSKTEVPINNGPNNEKVNSQKIVASRESIAISNKPWTRQEDMILLQSIKKEYSENSFVLISKKLEHRTVEQVKERCQTLLSLLEKMM